MSATSGPENEAHAFPAWGRHDLKRPVALFAAVAGFAVTAPAALVAGCNVHEIGHAVVGVSLGWEVERVNLCLPGDGSVEYARIGTSAGNLQGYAGGLIAAMVLLIVYFVFFALPRRPLRGPGWWAAALGVALWVGPQIILGILEGVAGPGRDYTDFIRDAPALYLPLIALSILAGAAAHVWRWREVWLPRRG